MKLMVIGGGGREHAIIKKLKQNKRVETIYALPGNGGIAADAVCVPIKATELESIKAFALKEQIDFAVVAPDDPLVLGAVDMLEEAGIRCFGPDKKAARIEGSKVFSKNLMKKYNIPTAAYETFEDADKAMKYLEDNKSYPIVIKADGLALGKGAIICENYEDACSTVKSIMFDKVFGDSGNKIVIEEFLTGPEVSLLVFTDGKTTVPMVTSMDHKRAHDNDEGLNTGGMGCIAPNPFYTKEVAEACIKNILNKTIEAMNKEESTFKGCLYIGLMITADGRKVIEYNCRFGDPETQVVLPLLETDLLDIFEAVRDEKLNELEVSFSNKSACCVMIASDGYPEKYEKGYKIDFGNTASIKDINVYHSGTLLDDNGDIRNNGGRVLGISAVADNLEAAIELAYKGVNEISFENKYYRNDIGKRASQILRRDN